MKRIFRHIILKQESEPGCFGSDSCFIIINKFLFSDIQLISLPFGALRYRLTHRR